MENLRSPVGVTVPLRYVSFNGEQRSSNYLLLRLLGKSISLAHTKSKAGREEDTLFSTSASRYRRILIPKYTLPDNEMPRDAAYQLISDELMLDGNPRLNLASFVTTWMEPECDKLILASLNKNYIDMDEYPITTELQAVSDPLRQSCWRDWHLSESENEHKAVGKPYDKPNIVTGSNVQVCWEKFARYFEVDLKEVKLRKDYYVMDPHKAAELVDENTICVCAILGSTYTGEFEDVKTLNGLLAKKNKEKGWNVGIHVDAASGGFVAPFLYPDLEWDFKLPLVRSINVSGHKYGLVYAGVGWVVWRSKEDLPEELIFHINYLGADESTFTLNFSKGASQIIGQYYQFLRLGFEGYKAIMANCDANATALREGIEATGIFEILSKKKGLPLVAFALKDRTNFDEYQISAKLRNSGWIVPAYTMAPDAKDVQLLRIVVREDFSLGLAERLFADLLKVIAHLSAHPPPKEEDLMPMSDSPASIIVESVNEIKPNLLNTVLSEKHGAEHFADKTISPRGRNSLC